MKFLKVAAIVVAAVLVLLIAGSAALIVHDACMKRTNDFIYCLLFHRLEVVRYIFS